MYYIYGVSVPSLLIESTDSMIYLYYDATNQTVIGVHDMHGRMHPNYCQITILLVQWNLSIMVAHGPEINGCNREVAALKKCLVYGILPIGA